MDISCPSFVGFALRLMFCDLNGHTEYPRSLRMRQRDIAVTDLPASEVVPRTIIAFPFFFEGTESIELDISAIINNMLFLDFKN